MKKYIWVWSFLFIMPLLVNAQSACDKLLDEAIRLQQTISINSQNQAIAKLKKAKACYDAADKQSLCQNQIYVSQNIIKYIRAQQQLREEIVSTTIEDTTSQLNRISKTNQTEHNDARLSFDCSQVVFKANGGYQKVIVKCNYSDWEITQKPDWISIYRSSDGVIVIEASSNDGEEIRAASLGVRCGKSVASLNIVQKKKIFNF